MASKVPLVFSNNQIELQQSTDDLDTTAVTQVYTDNSKKIATTEWVRLLLSFFNLTSTTAFTTTSTTPVVVTTMSQSLTAGTYLVLFSGQVSHSANNTTSTFSIFVNAVIQAFTTRTFTNASTQNKLPFLLGGIFTIASTQTIEVRASISSGTLTVGKRQFLALRIA